MAEGRWAAYNPNPKGRKDACDCVVRAFAVATGKSWDQVYADLCAIGAKQYRMPNSPEVYAAYAGQMGMTKGTIKVEKGTKRPTVDSFTKEHQKGIFVLRVANHLVAVKCGRYWDTWDCGPKGVYTYWAMPKGGAQDA